MNLSAAAQRLFRPKSANNSQPAGPADDRLWAILSEQNARFKPRNEDAGCIGVIRNAAGIPMRVAIVADGVSTARSGELASRMTVRGVIDYLRACQFNDVRQLAEDAPRLFREINNQLRDLSDSGTGTTLTVAVVFNERDLLVLHIGDCRVYHLTARGCRPLTKDHTLRQEAVDNGVDEDQVDRVHSHAISACLGVDSVVEPDVILNPPGVALNGGCLVLTTDGVHDVVTGGQMMGFMAENGSLAAFCQRCVETALRTPTRKGRPNKDNITVAIMKLGGAIDAPSLEVAGSLRAEDLSGAGNFSSVPRPRAVAQQPEAMALHPSVRMWRLVSQLSAALATTVIIWVGLSFWMANRNDGQPVSNDVIPQNPIEPPKPPAPPVAEPPRLPEPPKPDKPVAPGKPTETPKPAVAEQSAEQPKPLTPPVAEPPKPAEPKQPVVSGKPPESSKPVVTEKPTEQPKPSAPPVAEPPRPPEPPKPDKPVAPGKPTETPKPAVAEQSAEQPKPPTPPVAGLQTQPRHSTRTKQYYYVVKHDDTLEKIVKALFSQQDNKMIQDRVKKFAEENSLPDIHQIKEGQKLYVPRDLQKWCDKTKVARDP